MNKAAADYAVIRFVPDLARHETFNLGLVAWSEGHWILRFDEEAAKRIVRQNPHLASDFFPYLEAELEQRLRSIHKPEPEAILGVVRGLGLPEMTVSDPLLFALPGSSYENLSSRVDDLVQRVVTPRKTTGGAAEIAPFDALQGALKQWIKWKRIHPRHPFEGRTGVRRTIDFFSNGGTNVAVDAVKLNVKRADEIIGRADREANKVRDILATHLVNQYIVYCSMPSNSELRQVSSDASKIIRDSGAKVETTVEATVSALESYIAA